MALAWPKTLAKLEQLGEPGAVLTVDARNAFNSIDRAHCLRELYKAPGLAPLFGLVDMLYSTPSSVIFRLQDGSLRSIMSQQGVRQGCPLGPLLFSLGVHPVWSDIPDPSNRVNAAADLDDLAVVLPWNRTFPTLDKISAGLAKVGLSLAPGKLSLVCRKPSALPQEFQQEADRRGISLTTSTVLLGALVGASRDRTTSWAVRKVASSAPKLNLLLHPGLPRKLALQLVQEMCRSKLVYLSRVLPLNCALSSAKTLKVMVSNLMCKLGAPSPSFSEYGAEARFSLPDPVSAVPLHAWAGFCDSAQFYDWAGQPGHGTLTLPLVRSAKATLRMLSEEFTRLRAPRPDRLLPASVAGALQAFKLDPPKKVSRRLRSSLRRAARSALVGRLPVAQRARFHSQAAGEATFWLDSLGDYMSMPESLFRLALAFHLGQIPRGLGIPALCVCGKALDRDSCMDHFMVCRKLRGGQILRHDCVVRELARCAVDSGADVQVEPRRVLNYTRSRVDVIATWFDRSELLDVRISHPCAPTYVVRAAAEPGYTARVGEAAKEGKEVYQVMAQGLGGRFSPFVLESHGRFGPAAWKVLCAMAERAADISPFPREDERYFRYEFARRVSLALQRGNALLLQDALRARAAASLSGGHFVQ